MSAPDLRNWLSEAIAIQPPQDVVEWAESQFLLEWPPDSAVVAPIRLEPHQRAVLRHAFQRDETGRLRYGTIVYSTIKKSGKTTIGALVARWAAETWGRYGEIYTLANDYEQAKSRVFSALCQSVALHPRYNASRRAIPGRWLLKETEAIYVPTGSTVKALASEYRGSAGMNPSLTVFTELWGYVYEASRRLWVETTPSPTRANSIRFVETYAGFEGESELLWDLYQLGMEGRQLTANELGDLSAFAEAPNWDSLVPCWINEAAGLFVYWDNGELARRMPWQKGEAGHRYYQEQATQMTDNQFARLHLNEWSSGESEAVPIAWWDACEAGEKLKPNEGSRIPIVIGVDAGVSGDCTALVCVARHPGEHGDVVEFHTRVWYPEGQKLDYRSTLTVEIDALIEKYNVIQVAYDEYQLHHWATEQRDKRNIWYKPFSQGGDRLTADKQLYDIIRDRRLHHSGNAELRKHIQGCNAKIPKDEESKMRLVKKSDRSKIDAAVALSMACYECLRLSI